MRKTILAKLLALFALTAYSQNDVEVQGKWKIGFMFSSDFYTSARVNTESGGYVGYILDDSKYNFTTGLTGQYKIAPKLDIGLGITFSKKSFNADWFCHTCDIIGSTPTVPIELQFIEIPVFMRLYIIDKKMDLFTDFGLTGGFLTNDVSITEINDNNFLLSTQIGIGTEIDLGKNIGLNGTAMYKHSLKSFSNDNTLKLRSIGLVVGLVYHIK